MSDSSVVVNGSSVIVAEIPMELAFSISNGEDVRCGARLDEETGLYIGKIVNYPNDGLLKELAITNPIFKTEQIAVEAMQSVVERSNSVVTLLSDLCTSMAECSA
jgi:hypothetical protein